ncbi:hypothetical protein C0993_005752 [Termitomyces sp. T159_Od127]|nr:hypothetical protein C0993_005752 [Termitomyces sp. T159_Od127]
MRIAYGHQITSDEDPYLEIADNTSFALGNAGVPGNTPEEGTAKPSFVSQMLESLDYGESDDSNDINILDIKGAAGVIFCAGAETV